MKAPKISFKSFIFELVIVFVGVYGAFELNRYQEHQREQKIKLNYFKSFKLELNKLIADTSRTKDLIDQTIEELESSWANQEQPMLAPLEFYFSAEMLITRTGFNDDVFTQINPELSASLSGGFDNFQAVNQMLKEFDHSCSIHLLTKSRKDFYQGSGALKPEYNWYLKGLEELQIRFNSLEKMISEGALPATNAFIEELE